MDAAKREIIWSKQPLQYLKKSIDYIREDSVQNAEKITNSILFNLEKASKNPWHFPADKYKKANTGSYRVLKVYGFRISFFYDEKRIIVARIRHSKQKPLKF